MKFIEDVRFLILLVSVILAGAIIFLIFDKPLQEKFQKDINNNPKKYQAIIKSIETHKYHLPSGKLVHYEDIPEGLQNELEEINFNNNLDYISVRNAFSCKGLDVKLIYGKYEVNFSSCPEPDVLNQPTYQKNGLIEYWRINRNWWVVLDNDFI